MLREFRLNLADIDIRKRRMIKDKESAENSIKNQYYSSSKIQYQWIENLLEIPLEDGRKYVLWKILCPYLVNIKKLGYEETFEILKIWLEKCNKLRGLDFNPNTEIRTKLRYVKSYSPISSSKVKIDNPDFFKTLQDVKILES
jgi:hypothetical protein